MGLFDKMKNVQQMVVDAANDTAQKAKGVADKAKDNYEKKTGGDC